MEQDSPIEFGPFRLDPVAGQLLRDGAAVPLAPKAFAVLHYLAARPDRLIPKRELLSAVWPDVFVGDAVLKVSIRDIRKALGDSSQNPTYIETAHRRGYRFRGSAGTAGASGAAGSQGAAGPGTSGADVAVIAASGVASPPVKYARSGSVNIAYQVIGSGPIDLVFVMGWVSHLEYFWREPSFARFLTRLGGMARLIVFDKRGTGLSDAVPVSQLPALDERLDDVRAVMDAAGSERAVLLGVSEGGPLCALFAATYPERTEAVIMIGSYARRLRDDDYPWGRTLESHEAFCRTLLEEWGGPVGLADRAPSVANDPAFREWWATYLRMGASPGAVVALTRMNAQIDVRKVLPAVQAPTLVIHRTGDRLFSLEEGRYLASLVPGSTFVELPGDDHLPFVGDQEEILHAIEAFLAQTRARAEHDRVLATMLTVAAEGSAADLDLVRRAFTREVQVHRGRILASPADRFVASFDGPGRAVRCGRSVTTAFASRAGLHVGAGVHIGEYAASDANAPVLTVSAVLSKRAAPGQVLVTRTVVDLVHGSGLQFEDAERLEGMRVSVVV